MGPYEKHVFVCTSGEWCPRVDGDGIGVHKALKQQVASMGLRHRIRINNSGCFSQCGNGPMVVVYPDNIWYSHVTVDDVEEIMSRHLLGNEPVERLRYHHTDGPNVLPRDASGRPRSSSREESPPET